MLRRLAPFADDLWTHRSLLWQFTLRNVELRHKGSHLGLAWSFLNPLLMLGLYVLVFGYINGNKFGVIPNENETDYALAVFVGLTLYQFLGEILGSAPALITTNPNFVKKVVFPLEILPAAGVGASAFHLLIGLILALTGVLIFGSSLPLATLWLPVIILPLILLALGIAWLLSALGTFFRDIGQPIQFLSMVLLFSSAIFYSVQSITPNVWIWMRYNPLLIAIESAREVVLWHRPLNLTHLAYLYVAGLTACYIGHAAFRKMKPAFADVL